MMEILPERGSQDPQYQAHLSEILNELTAFRFSPKQVEALCDQVRDMVETVRGHERKVLDFCVEKLACQERTSLNRSPAMKAT